MNYQYRWYYAMFIFIGMIGWGYLYDLSPACSQLTDLKETEKRLQEKLMHLQQYAHVSTPLIAISQDKQPDIMAMLLNAAQFCGLTVNSITLPMPRLIRVVAVGEYAQMVQFAEALLKQKKPLLIRNFVYQRNQQHTLTMTMELAIYDGMVDEKPLANFSHALDVFQDPFCGAQAFTMINEHDLYRYSIQQIKMLGYLQQAGLKVALIALPNNTMMDVQVGSEIGSEKAIVTQLSDHDVTLMLPSGLQARIQMEKDINHAV